MKHEMNKKKDGTIELTITIPWKSVKESYDSVFDSLVKTIEVKGFRKGKVPKNIAKKHIDTAKIYEEVVKRIVPESYTKAVTTEKLRPIVHPQLELKKAKEKEDWVIVARTCEKPKIILGKYKEKIKTLKTKKHKNIWVPGQDVKKDKKKEEDSKPSVDEILNVLLDAVTIQVPSILIEQQVQKLLADLVDRTKSLGLTMDQYLASTGKTGESVRKEFEEQARKTLTLEFALEEIANIDKVSVSEEDINTVIKSSKSEKEKEALGKQRYYLASILRRQKTIEHLTSL